MDIQPKIDEIDIKILKALLKDARASFADIAKECNVSIPAISKRFQKLKKSGVITGTTVVLNFKDSPIKHGLSVDIRAISGFESAIIEAIKKIPNVFDCFKVIGRHDIHVAIGVESLAQIERIRSIIKRQQGVLTIEITTSIDERHFYPENLEIEPTKDVKNGSYRPKNN